MLGVAIGIAAVVAVLGITRSSQADLLARIDRLGTNLLTVVNGRSLAGNEVQLPETAAATIARVDGVLGSTPTAELDNVTVRRSDLVPAQRGPAVAVRATDGTLLSTLDGQLAYGTFLNEAAMRYPTVVLGHGAAEALGIADLNGSPLIMIGDDRYIVVGILRPLELAGEIDNSALIGFPVAADHFAYDGHPTRIYVRAQTDRTGEVRGMLARASRWSPSAPTAPVRSRRSVPSNPPSCCSTSSCPERTASAS